MAGSEVLVPETHTQHEANVALNQSQEQGIASESFELGHGQWNPATSHQKSPAGGSAGVHVWGEGHALREGCPCGCEGDPEDTSGLSWRDDGTAQTLNSDASLSNSPWDEEARRKRRLHVDPLAGWRTAFSDPLLFPSRAAGLSLTSDLSGPFHAPTWPGLAPRGGGSDLSSGHRPDYGTAPPIVGLRDPAMLHHRKGGFEGDVVSSLRLQGVPPPDMGSVKVVRPIPTDPVPVHLPTLSGTDSMSENDATSDSRIPDLAAPAECKGSERSGHGAEGALKAVPAEDGSVNPENWPSLADLWEKGILYNMRAQSRQLSRLCAPCPAPYSPSDRIGHLSPSRPPRQSPRPTPSPPTSPAKSLSLNQSTPHSPHLLSQPSELSHWVRNHWLPPPMVERSAQSADSASLGWAAAPDTQIKGDQQNDAISPEGVSEKEVSAAQVPPAPSTSPETVTLALLSSPQHSPPETAQLLPLPDHCPVPQAFPNAQPSPKERAVPFEFSPSLPSNSPQPCLQLRLAPPQQEQPTVFHPAPSGTSGLAPSCPPPPPNQEVNGKLTRSLSATIRCHSPPLSPSPPLPENPEAHKHGHQEGSCEGKVQELSLGNLQDQKESVRSPASSRLSSPAPGHPYEPVSSQGSPDESPRPTLPPVVSQRSQVATPPKTAAKTSSVGVQTDAIIDEQLLKDMVAMQQAVTDGAQAMDCGRPPSHSIMWNGARQQTGPQGPLTMTPIKVSSLPRRYSPSPPASPGDVAQLSPLAASKTGMLQSNNTSMGATQSGAPGGPNQSKPNVFDPFLNLQFHFRPDPYAIPCTRHGYLCRTPHHPYARSRSSLVPAGAPDPTPASALGLSPLSATKASGQQQQQRNERTPPAPRKPPSTCVCPKCASWSAPPACTGYGACTMGSRCSALSHYPGRSWSNPVKPSAPMFPGCCPQSNLPLGAFPQSPTTADNKRATADRRPDRLLPANYPLQLHCNGPHPPHFSMQGAPVPPPPNTEATSNESASRHMFPQMSLGDMTQWLAVARQRQGELGMGGMQAFGPPLPSLGGTASALATAGLHSLEACQDRVNNNGRSLGLVQRECSSPGSRGSHQQNGVQADARQQQVGGGSNSSTGAGQHLDHSSKSRQLQQHTSAGPESNVPLSSPPVDAIRASLSRPVAIRPSPRTPPTSHLSMGQGGMSFSGMQQVMEADVGWNFAEWAGQLPPLFSTGLGRMSGPLQSGPPMLSYSKKAEGEENSLSSVTGAAAIKDGSEEGPRLGAPGLAIARLELPSMPSFDMFRQHGWGGMQHAADRAVAQGLMETGQLDTALAENTYGSLMPSEYPTPQVQIDALAKNNEEGLSNAQAQSVQEQQSLPTSAGSNQVAGALTPTRGKKRLASTQDVASSGAPVWLDQLAKRQKEQ